MSELTKQWQAPSALTIYEVEKLAEEWLDPSQWDYSWQFDLTATEEIDSCGIQFLLYLKQCLDERQQQLVLFNMQGDVRTGIELMGLLKELSDQGAMHE